MDILTRLRNVTPAGRRSICVWLGFVVLFWLTIVPPWMETYRPSTRVPPRYSKLYHAPIFDAPVIGFGESADVDYPRMFTEIALGECFVLALYLTWGRLRPEKTPAQELADKILASIRSSLTTEEAAALERRYTASNSPPIAKAPDITALEKLRQNLRLKTLYNEQLIDHLIQIERDRSPNASLQELMEAAIARWEWSSR